MTHRHPRLFRSQPDSRDASWNARTSSAIANPWLFTGQEWMADLGLCNYKNRFYSPKLGRFLQNDPVRFDAGDENLYRYVLNNPVNCADTTGQIITIQSYTAPNSDGHTFSRPTTARELAVWDKGLSQMSKSARGREILEKANDPNFKLTVDNTPGNRPGGTPGVDGHSGTLMIDLSDPSGISPVTREAMLKEALEDGRVSSKEDFDNQVPKQIGPLIGHEMGHAIEGDHDEAMGGNNVEKNENPIRKGVGEEPRKKYDQTEVNQENKN